MKINIKHLPAVGLVALAMGAASCTDQIAFGDKFLEKAPGGDITADSIFHKAEYTRNFLASGYAYQYYNLPGNSSSSCPQYANYWKGAPDVLDDTHHLTWSGSLVYSSYYNGMLTSMADGYGNYNIYPYNNMHIWENIRTSNLLLERVDEVPDMSDEEKARVKDEARCLLAYTYFWAFRFYGGLPLIDFTFNGNETGYEGRKSAQETIDFILGLLDTVIKNNNLKWAYSDAAEAASQMGHWTIAGAMGLKIQLLQFAASPLLNSAQSYFDGKYTMEHPEYVWLGGYDASRWTAFRQACKDFFDAVQSRGYYALEMPEGTSEGDYAYAYRKGYMFQDSKEVIHSVRVANVFLDNNYNWYMLGWGNKSSGIMGAPNERMAYNATQEYVEMFPWADGTPFDWDKAEAEGKLDNMFIKGDSVYGEPDLQNVSYTRDPRLYENTAVNGQRAGIAINNGERSGQYFELYVGGTSAGQDAFNNSGAVSTGYRILKYLAGSAFLRQNCPQWNPIMLSELMLAYAEAIIQDGGSAAEAIQWVDKVRARVGMKGLVECNPDKNLLSDKDALLEEILRERACELALNCVRYFDLIRYKRADRFEKPLHYLLMYRIGMTDDGTLGRVELPWYNGQRLSKGLTKDDYNFYEPRHFEFERPVITNGARKWWTDGFDPKWYFQPFPITEVNKGYGLDQNPGW